MNGSGVLETFSSVKSYIHIRCALEIELHCLIVKTSVSKAPGKNTSMVSSDGFHNGGYNEL